MPYNPGVVNQAGLFWAQGIGQAGDAVVYALQRKAQTKEAKSLAKEAYPDLDTSNMSLEQIIGAMQGRRVKAQLDEDKKRQELLAQQVAEAKRVAANKAQMGDYLRAFKNNLEPGDYVESMNWGIIPTREAMSPLQAALSAATQYSGGAEAAGLPQDLPNLLQQNEPLDVLAKRKAAMDKLAALRIGEAEREAKGAREAGDFFKTWLDRSNQGPRYVPGPSVRLGIGGIPAPGEKIFSQGDTIPAPSPLSAALFAASKYSDAAQVTGFNRDLPQLMRESMARSGRWAHNLEPFDIKGMSGVWDPYNGKPYFDVPTQEKLSQARFKQTTGRKFPKDTKFKVEQGLLFAVDPKDESLTYVGPVHEGRSSILDLVNQGGAGAADLDADPLGWNQGVSYNP